MSQPTIDVLLATYNGARFLREQIDSVLAQRDVDIRILAHDDGSTDETMDLLRDYERTNPQHFHLLVDDVRTGSAKNNFAHLLRASTAEYAAFCDQDDVWIPEKLSVSMDAMRSLEAQHGAGTSLLTYTDLRVVDESLRTVSESLWRSNSLRDAARPSFAQLLTENVATGCTALLNNPLVILLRTIPPEAQMHDHWAALVAGGLGVIKPISQATVLYRQHSRNVVGAVATQASLTDKLLRLVSREGYADRAHQFALDHAQAKSLLRLYGKAMPPKHRDVLEAFLVLPKQSRMQRLRSVSTHHLWKTDPQRRIAQILDLLR